MRPLLPRVVLAICTRVIGTTRVAARVQGTMVGGRGRQVSRGLVVVVVRGIVVATASVPVVIHLHVAGHGVHVARSVADHVSCPRTSSPGCVSVVQRGDTRGVVVVVQVHVMMVVVVVGRQEVVGWWELGLHRGPSDGSLEVGMRIPH